MVKTKMKIARVDKYGIHTYSDYEVDFDPNKSILQVLREVYRISDRTLGFRRYSCNRGVCGSCTMKVNGKIKRTCITPMEKDMIIEPVGDEFIRDIVTRLK